MFILKDQKSKSSHIFDNFFCCCFQKPFKIIFPDCKMIEKWLASKKSSLNDFWKQKQKKLSKFWEDLDFWSFKIKIGCLYISYLRWCFEGSDSPSLKSDVVTRAEAMASPSMTQATPWLSRTSLLCLTNQLWKVSTKPHSQDHVLSANLMAPNFGLKLSCHGGKSMSLFPCR